MWWKRRRFERPVAAWAAGKTNETTRDIVHAKLFGRGAAAHGYVECQVRTMTTGGLVMMTFTPLEGMSDVVMSFLSAQRESA